MMTRVGVVTSYATSLKVVGNTIVRTLKKLGHEAQFFTYRVPCFEAQKLFDRSIIVIPFDPTYLPAWVLLQRDYVIHRIPSVTYVTVEGRPKPNLIPDWVRRDGAFVANSNYTAKMLSDVDVDVVDVIHHGLDLDEFKDVTPHKEEIKAKLKCNVLMGTVASGLKRKGLDVLSDVAASISETIPDLKFYVLTTPEGALRLRGIKNVVVDPNFGKYSRRHVLELIASFDFYLCTSYAEGFCLPVLEAQALGVPVIYPQYDPLIEVTDPEANFPVPVVDEKFVDDGFGILIHYHIYDVGKMVEMIEKAYEIVTTSPEEYEKLRNRVWEFATNFDALKLYSKFFNSWEGSNAK